jgi:sugar/nucleoside kinase (ribokinase family)
MSELLIVGSVAYDGIATPFGSVKRALGGAATYSAIASSLFAPTAIVGVVGKDFLASDIALLKSKGVDLTGLEVADGKTFFWKGVYGENMNSRTTLQTDLNVFAAFNPKIPQSQRDIPFLFLANIHPALQLSVYNQMKKPKFTALDTMNLWIETANKDLMKILRKVDLIVLNDEEIRLLTGEYHITKGAKALAKMGPRYVIVKTGEHGAMLFGPKGMLVTPAYALESVKDPTGAGDTFAGAFMGYLAKRGKVTDEVLKEAVVVGHLVASFTVQDFGVNRVASLKRSEVAKRAKEYNRFAKIPVVKI